MGQLGFVDRIEILDDFNYSAVAKDQDPVAAVEQLAKLCCGEDDRNSARSQFFNLLIDLVFRQDIETAQGLVEKQDPGFCADPACQNGLLLVAAAKLPGGLLLARGGSPAY